MFVLVGRTGLLINFDKFFLVPPRVRVYFLGGVEEVLSMCLFGGVVARIVLILHDDFLDVLVLYVCLDGIVRVYPWSLILLL